jgi:putative selenium metabolism hydrolase
MPASQTPETRSPVVELCQDFLRIPSLSGEEGPLAALVATRMQAMGFQVGTDRLGNVLGRRQGTAPGPTLLFDSHLDVVPVQDPTAWTRAPYGAELAQGRLWGRGAADTKGSLAAMLCAGAATADFRGTLLVSASVCEENMTALALAEVLERHPADLVIVGEPTSLRLGTAQKGRAGLWLEAAGRSAHSSRPELGDNAIDKVMEALSRLRALPLPSDPDLGPALCEVIEIDSAPRPSPGLVPHACTARLALRLLPGETAQAVLERTTRCLDGLAGVSVRLVTSSQRCYTGLEISMVECVPGWRAPASELQTRLLAALGTTAYAAPYTTNASAAAARGIPTFLLGPGSIEQAHSLDEWISLEQLEAAPLAYAAVIRTFLG